MAHVGVSPRISLKLFGVKLFSKNSNLCECDVPVPENCNKIFLKLSKICSSRPIIQQIYQLISSVGPYIDSIADAAAIMNEVTYAVHWKARTSKQTKPNYRVIKFTNSHSCYGSKSFQ